MGVQGCPKIIFMKIVFRRDGGKRRKFTYSNRLPGIFTNFGRKQQKFKPLITEREKKMNTLINKTWSYKWMFVVVFSLGLILTGTARATTVVTPMAEDLDANSWDVNNIDELEVEGLSSLLGGFTTIGPELIDDPYFDDEDCWDETDGWDVNETDGIAVSNNGPDDTLAEENPFTVKSGVDYIIEVDITVIGGGISVSLGGDSEEIKVPGVNIFTLTTTSTAAFKIDTIGGPPVTLTSVSVKESGPGEVGYLDVLDTIDIGSKLYLTGTAAFDPGTLNITGPNGVFFYVSPQAAPDVLVVTGGDGTANDNSEGSKGSDISLTTGAGGGSCPGPAGAGGDMTLTTKSGGSSPTNHGGDGGDVTITTGAGGDGSGVSFSAGDGGDIELTPGAGGSGSSGAANGSYGDVIIAQNGGNVGIGTASPSSKLDVNGAVAVSGKITNVTDPTADQDAATKKYVDDTAKTGSDAMHDTEGGYNNVDVNSVKTKVYTKYLRGTLDNDSSTNVAHGISSALTKILHVSVLIYHEDAGLLRCREMFETSVSDLRSVVSVDSTNVIISSGSALEECDYVVKIDYIL
jgi:hypothetical protein